MPPEDEVDVLLGFSEHAHNGGLNVYSFDSEVVHFIATGSSVSTIHDTSVDLIIRSRISGCYTRCE